jgi:hypothetical protein
MKLDSRVWFVRCWTVLKRCLSIPKRRIFDSSVWRAIPGCRTADSGHFLDHCAGFANGFSFISSRANGPAVSAWTIQPPEPTARASPHVEAQATVISMFRRYYFHSLRSLLFEPLALEDGDNPVFQRKCAELLSLLSDLRRLQLPFQRSLSSVLTTCRKSAAGPEPHSTRPKLAGMNRGSIGIPLHSLLFSHHREAVQTVCM